MLERGIGGSEEVAKWEKLENGEVARWEVSVFFFISGGHRVSPRFHLFVFDVEQQRNKGAR